MDVSYLHSLGWKHKIELPEGIKQVYEDFKKKEGVKAW
jgi:GDP-L-fucose synthase